ncbi:MAG: glycosyltransferase, partial [Deltaproteobacteria bacterium]|nr:glycosyltransferase [Deltaproteobacteria bacterium]
LIPLKGLHLLLEVLQYVPATAWQLTVLGSVERDPVYVRQVRRHIAAKGWGEQVRLRGLLSQTEVGDCLAASDVFAMPSCPEGYSIAYQEALSHGLPVLAHAESDGADLIEHGVSGFHLHPQDLPSGAQYLQTLTTDRAMLARMSLAARTHFERLPTWEQSLAAAAEFLEDLGTRRVLAPEGGRL